jgi:hypothetical protein
MSLVGKLIPTMPFGFEKLVTFLAVPLPSFGQLPLSFTEPCSLLVFVTLHSTSFIPL